jgi:hypothetical protein
MISHTCKVINAPRPKGICVNFEWGVGRQFVWLLNFWFHKLQILLLYLPVDKCIDYVSTAGAYYSPAGPDKILVANLMFHDCPFVQVRQHSCGSDSSIAIHQDAFNHIVLLINGQVANIIVQWAVSDNMSWLATLVAWLSNHFWLHGPINGSGRECVQRGGHCCQGHRCLSIGLKKQEGGSSWVCDQHCGQMSQGIMKSLVC